MLDAPVANAQGCIIARGAGGTMLLGGEGFLNKGDFQLNVAHRYFNSDRHFIGDSEQDHRQSEHTQVENYSHFIDATFTYAIHRQVWLNLTLPFVRHERSSLYEHDRINRHSTFSGGLGDVRLTSTFWLLDPDVHHRGNIALGAGVKAPTGDYKEKDTFYRPSGKEKRYVDSSIQPGDGGWGAVVDAQGFYAFTGSLSGYLNGFYQINPRERVKSTGFSVPDGYMGRAGLAYALWPTLAPRLKVEKDFGFSLALSLGGRIEGVPARDLFGGSDGRRRPGYSVGVEPGITVTKGRLFLSFTTPIAVYRDRVQSYPESKRNPEQHGDAAFADYSLNLSTGIRF